MLQSKLTFFFFFFLLYSVNQWVPVICVDHSPDCGVHAAVIELFAVQLSEEREQDLDASYRVDGTVDGVGNNGLHVLWDRQGLLALTRTTLYCMEGYR